MGTLIIGSLLVIALLAIVGSIFAARGGSTTGEARRTPAAPAPKAASSEMRVETSPVATPSQLEEPAEQSLPPVPGAVNNGLMTHDELLTPTTPLPNGQPVYNSDGQVHELTIQLQALHEEARYLSQRLSILTEMAEHIEARQSNHAEDGV